MAEPGAGPGRIDGLRARWRALALGAGLHGFEPVGEALLAAYGGAARRYHGLGHIAFLLDEIDRLRSAIADPALLGFTAWFHDAIYDPLARDNEERSAALARRDLAACGAPAALAAAVAVLVLKTKSHQQGEASPDEALFLDMDFAILGAPVDIYARYVADVRAEYAAVSDDAWRTGRGAFLEAALAQPRLFRTGRYETERGAQARVNLAAEREALRRGQVP